MTFVRARTLSDLLLRSSVHTMVNKPLALPAVLHRAFDLSPFDAISVSSEDKLDIEMRSYWPNNEQRGRQRHLLCYPVRCDVVGQGPSTRSHHSLSQCQGLRCLTLLPNDSIFQEKFNCFLHCNASGPKWRDPDEPPLAKLSRYCNNPSKWGY